MEGRGGEEQGKLARCGSPLLPHILTNSRGRTLGNGCGVQLQGGCSRLNMYTAGGTCEFWLIVGCCFSLISLSCLFCFFLFLISSSIVFECFLVLFLSFFLSFIFFLLP